MMTQKRLAIVFVMAVALVTSCKAGDALNSTCSNAVEGCPCTDAGACETGLTCLANACVALAGNSGGSGGVGGAQADGGVAGQGGGLGGGAGQAIAGQTGQGGRAGAEGEPDGGTGDADAVFVPAINNDVDILFMVDNSGSMKEEQDKIRKSFPVLINALRSLPRGLPNLHIGVISSDVGAGNQFISGNPACNRPGGDRGELQVKTGCGLSPDSAFIISLNGDTQKNYQGKLEDVFACMADLGTQGCGFEHQLQSVRVALAGSATPRNNGFLRPNALLVIVMLTDEDDCSGHPTADLFADQSFEGQSGSLRCNLVGHICNGASPPSAPFTTPLQNCVAAPRGGGRLIDVNELSGFVLGLKPNATERIIVSAIAGVPSNPLTAQYAYSTVASPVGGPSLLDIEPVCSAGAAGSAGPSLRIGQFVKAFGANGRMESICEGDFTGAFARLAQNIALQIH